MVEASVGETVRLRAVQVRVVASLDGLRSIPIPDSLKASLQHFLVTEVHHGREPTVS